MQFGSSPASLQLGHHWFIIEMWNIDLILFLRHLMASSPLEIWSVSTYRAKGEGFKFYSFLSDDYHISALLYFHARRWSLISTFKNCHSFQNREISTSPENWHSFSFRFFVLVNNFSRLPKSRLAILVRELQYPALHLLQWQCSCPWQWQWHHLSSYQHPHGGANKFLSTHPWGCG